MTPGIQISPSTALPVLAALEQMGAIQPDTTAHQAVFKLRNAPLGLIKERSVHADPSHEHSASTLFRLHRSKGGVAHRFRMMGTPWTSEALHRTQTLAEIVGEARRFGIEGI